MKPVKLHFKSYGEGDKVLIIMHGLMGTLDNWHTLSGQYAQDFKVYSLDLRDHGKSPHTEGLSYHVMAEDLKLFMERENIDQAIILGHSMGAKTAMFFAHYYPALVYKLILVDMTPFEGKGNHDYIFHALGLLKLDQLERRSEADEILSETIKEMPIRQLLLKNLYRTPEGFQWKLNLEGIHNTYDAIREEVPLDWPFDKPTLFIRGGRSPYIKPDDLEAIQIYYPNAELITVEKAGHWVHADCPDEFYEVSLAFMKKG